jgi:hypothetical protein
MYKLECHLVSDVEEILSTSDNPFSELRFALEFNHSDGRVDIIALTVEGELIAFEAKLTRWRIAINQAYRNTSFSHYSYVMLPQQTVKNALKRRHEFETLGIGLCSVDPSGITVEIPASRKAPFQPWLTDTAMQYITSRGETCPHSYRSRSSLRSLAT